MVEKISEASRLQRKGRVGRIGDGTVYYMYKRFARKMIKPKYKITQEDVSLLILSLLGNKELDDLKINDKANIKKLYLHEKLNPNLPNFFMRSITDEQKNSFLVKSKLYDIYNENFQIIKHHVTKGLKIIKNYFDDEHMDGPLNIFNTGQILENILDYYGLFYLIHPFENSLKRNILNKIIQFDKIKQYTNAVPKSAYRFMLNFLYSNNLLIDYNGDSLYQYVTDINKTNRNFVKTELATKIESITGKLQTNIINAITLIAASAMGCFNEVYEINIFLEIISYSMKNLMNTNIKWKKFKQTYGAYVKSDLMFIFNLIQKIKQRFSNLMVFNINSNAVQIILNIHSDNILNNFKELVKRYNEPPQHFNTTLWNKLMALKNNGTLKNDYKKVILSDKTTYRIINDNIEKNSNEIISWCNKNLLNENIIINFIKKYGEHALSQLSPENKKIFEWTNNYSSNFNRQLTDNTIDEKIIRSFLYGRPTQFTYSIKNSKYVTLINFNYYNVKFAETFFTNENETLTNLSNELTFYINFTDLTESNTENADIVNVTILNQIKTEWLVSAIPLLINPILCPDVILNSGIYDNKNVVEFINSHFMQIFKRSVINNWNQHIFVWNSKDMPILTNFNKSIYKFIISLYNN